MTADQIAITEGAGKNVATETISGKDYGIVKIVSGAAGETTGMTVGGDGSALVSVVGSPTVEIIGSVATAGNQSISGTVGASAVGTIPVTQSGTVITSVSGTANIAVTSVATVNGGVPVNAPITKWVSGEQSLVDNKGASVAVIAAQGSGVYTYVTGVQLANMGSASVLVTLAGNDSGGSTLGYTIAPAGGGSNIRYENALKTGSNVPFTASISGVASVYISAQGFTSET